MKPIFYPNKTLQELVDAAHWTSGGFHHRLGLICAELKANDGEILARYNFRKNSIHVVGCRYFRERCQELVGLDDYNSEITIAKFFINLVNPTQYRSFRLFIEDNDLIII